jgi:hypothetical protein
MDNPWLELQPSEDSFVLQMDRECIQKHNEQSRSEKTKFMVRSIPEPFIGDPNSATVILLGKNPGHRSKDEEDHLDKDFKKAIFDNLHHKAQEYPFYPLNPEFLKTGAGEWWRKHTRELREEPGNIDEATLARRLMVIEWFPYHSIRLSPPKTQCRSQQYSFELAKQILDRKLLIVGMRGRKEWMKVDDRFGEIPFLNSPQNVSLTRGNTHGDLFNQIVKALKGNALQ